MEQWIHMVLRLRHYLFQLVAYGLELWCVMLFYITDQDTSDLFIFDHDTKKNKNSSKSWLFVIGAVEGRYRTSINVGT